MCFYELDGFAKCSRACRLPRSVSTLDAVRQHTVEGRSVQPHLRSTGRYVRSLLPHCYPSSCRRPTDSLADERLRVTKKTIPRYTSYVDIKRHDLYLPEEKQEYAKFPNFDSNLASIKVPSLAYWSRLLLGSYQDLYIVSPESSPSSSQADEDSRQTSPISTWGRQSPDEARLRAMQSEGQSQ